MAGRSHKPIVWGLFAGGGTIAAFFAPVMIFVTLVMPLLFGGAVEGGILEYERVHAFVENWLIKIILFGLIGLQLWHAAHRLRITAHDFGIRADGPVSWAVYMVAGILTILCAVFLVSI
jgi:fumarate reductase subunit D